MEKMTNEAFKNDNGVYPGEKFDTKVADKIVGKTSIDELYVQSVTVHKTSAQVVTGVNIYLPKKDAIELFKFFEERVINGVNDDYIIELKNKILSSLLGD